MAESKAYRRIEVPPFQPGDPSRFVFPSRWGGEVRGTEPCEVGIHRLRWCAGDRKGDRLPAGVYFLRLEAGGAHSDTKVPVTE